MEKLPNIQSIIVSYMFQHYQYLSAIELFQKLNNYFAYHFDCVSSLCT